MRELDVPASRPAFHAPGRVLALRYFAEASRGRLLARRERFEGASANIDFAKVCRVQSGAAQTRRVVT